MIALRDQKVTMTAIAKRYGISRERVRQILSKVGKAGFIFIPRSEEEIKKSREKRLEYSKKLTKEWKKNNPEKVAEQQRNYQNKRVRKDQNFKIRKNLRSRLWAALTKQNTHKIESTEELLGCSVKDARNYLSTKFKDGMSWDNYGEWEIDHIRPCSSFDLTDQKQREECFNIKNLQPLWRIENNLKGNTWQDLEE